MANHQLNWWLVTRFMPDATTFNKLSIEIKNREVQVQEALRKLDNDLKKRPELAKILSDWCILSDSDKITAARMYTLYGEAKKECEKDSRWRAQVVVENVIKESEEAERITAHPYIKYQKARILQLIDRSKILDEAHTGEIVEGFRNAIFVIKTVEQFSIIQNTKSYASLLWLFGQYLSDINQKEESIRYLEEGKIAFESMKIVDREYYQCISKLGTVYLDYFEGDKMLRKRYLEKARQVSEMLPASSKKLGKYMPFVTSLKQRVGKYKMY